MIGGINDEYKWSGDKSKLGGTVIVIVIIVIVTVTLLLPLKEMNEIWVKPRPTSILRKISLDSTRERSDPNCWF